MATTPAPAIICAQNPIYAPCERGFISFGVPFALGELRPADHIEVLDGAMPRLCQTRPLVHWDDGSIKWLLVEFQADFGPQECRSFEVNIADQQHPQPKDPAVVVQERDNLIHIDTGVLEISFPRNRANPFGEIVFRGRGITSRPGEFSVTDAEGVTYRAKLDDRPEISVLDAGPVHAAVRTAGRFVSEQGKPLLNFNCIVHAYAGTARLLVEPMFINLEDDHVTVGAVALEQSFDFGGDHTRTIKQLHWQLNDWLPRFVRIRGKVGLRTNHQRTVVEPFEVLDQRPEDFPDYQRAGLDTAATHLGLWGNSGGVTTKTIRTAEQYDKHLSSEGGQIRWELWPTWAQPFELRQGMAKRHQIALAFCPEAASPEEGQRLLGILDNPLHVWLNFERFTSCKVNNLEHHMPCDLARYPRTEQLVSGLTKKAMARGMLDYGDDPNQGYTSNYDSTGIKPPGTVWTNNEYGWIRAAFVQFARSGDYWFYDGMCAAARHLIEVDFVRKSDDPWKHRGVPAHCVDHTTGSAYPSHMWTEGLLDYYCLTGDREVLDMARGIGDLLLRYIDERSEIFWVTAREGGWSLIALAPLYEVTHQGKYREGCFAIIDMWEQLRQERGGYN